jgi:hypothetical protein
MNPKIVYTSHSLFLILFLPFPAMPSLLGFAIRCGDVRHWPFQVGTNGAASGCSANKTKGTLMTELN